MGDGSKPAKPKVTSRMPVSALSAECKFKDILLSQNHKSELKDILGLESTHLESQVAKTGLNGLHY